MNAFSIGLPGRMNWRAPPRSRAQTSSARPVNSGPLSHTMLRGKPCWAATRFKTTDKGVVEEHCRVNGIQTEWKDNDRLRTRVVRPAVAYHPKTGEPIWFDHATFFHVSTWDPEIGSVLMRQFKEADLA